MVDELKFLLETLVEQGNVLSGRDSLVFEPRAIYEKLLFGSFKICTEIAEGLGLFVVVDCPAQYFSGTCRRGKNGSFFIVGDEYIGILDCINGTWKCVGICSKAHILKITK